jgi:hypothetical protein
MEFYVIQNGVNRFYILTEGLGRYKRKILIKGLLHRRCSAYLRFFLFSGEGERNVVLTGK